MTKRKKLSLFRKNWNLLEMQKTMSAFSVGDSVFMAMMDRLMWKCGIFGETDGVVVSIWAWEVRKEMERMFSERIKP